MEPRHGDHRALGRRAGRRRRRPAARRRSTTRRGACRPPRWRSPRPPRSTTSVKVAVDAAAGVGRVVAEPARRRRCSACASCSTPTATTWPPSSPASTARCSPTPGARWPAASTASSSPAASRTCSRARTAPRCRAASTCTPCCSRSASSPASRRSTSRSWSRCGCWPTRWPAGTRSCSSRPRRTRRRRCCWPSWCSGPGSPTACSTWCRATPRRSTPCSAHPDVDAVSFVGSTPVARHIYETGTRARQAGPGPRRGQEPHGRAARRRRRRRRRRRHLGGLRVGGRAVHGDLGGRRGRRGRRPAGRRHRRPHPRRGRRARATTPAR